MNTEWLQVIENSIAKGGEISPFLFIAQNLEILHADISHYVLELLKNHDIDAQSMFVLHSSDEPLKISQVKQFISVWQVRSRFAFQVFIIEDISRMTQQAQNACLKFFEEPWEWNIVVLTATSTAGILDTILSRLQVHSIWTYISEKGSEFYMSMIRSYCEQDSQELITYMFSAKLEKGEYIGFLKSLIEYISLSRKHVYLLDQIHEDIGGILKNNLQGKYVCDKYILLLRW